MTKSKIKDTTQSIIHPCNNCTEDGELGFSFEFAYQPIVDINANTTIAHEALVRGPNGEGAMSVLNQVTNKYQFDQACRVKAIKTATEINFEGDLSINFMPNAVYRPELCIRTTLMAAEKYNFDIQRIIFEFTEQELIKDPVHVSKIINDYKKRGFKTAIDDFGAGYAGLNLIANFDVDIIKIDMGLIRDIDTNKRKQSIVRAVTRMCEELNVTVIAEGIETLAEKHLLADFGIHLFQGFLFCKPSFKSAGTINPEAWL